MQETGLTNQGKFSAAFGSPFILRERQLFSEPVVPPVAHAGQELSAPYRTQLSQVVASSQLGTASYRLNPKLHEILI